MKKILGIGWLLAGTTASFFMTTSFAVAAQVAVVPLMGRKATGDAMPVDVLKGKTFSNANGNSLTGTRSPALPGKTGQQDCWVSPGTSVPCAGTGQDGELQKGTPWPKLRFTDNNNGSVTDNLTGLVWMQNANCRNDVSRDVALTFAQTIFDGYGGVPGEDCGLNDGSVAGDWRLPNRFELESLLDLSQQDPALPIGHPFQNVQSSYYWTSSYNSYFKNLGVGWAVSFSAGDAEPRSWALEPSYVWVVRDGQ